MTLDQSTFTSTEQCTDLFGNAIRKTLDYSVYGNTTVFTAKVLTPPIRIGESVSSGFMNSGLAKKLLGLLGSIVNKVTDKDGNEQSKTVTTPVNLAADKFVVRARIDDKNSPHSFLPDPCNEAFALNPHEAAKLIALHTIFVSTAETAELSIKVGDIIKVRLEKFVDGSYNLQYGEIVELDSVGAGPTGACIELAKMVSPQQKFNFVQRAMRFVGDWTAEEGGWRQRAGVEYYDFPKSLGVLDSSVRGDFEAFFAELRSMGINPTVNSARRSVKHQWGLYTQLFGKYSVVASPCGSDHQYGFAIDMAVDGRTPGTRERDIAAKHNIKWYGPGDEVHFYHNTSGAMLKKLKKKCRDYYYTKYGSNAKNWPKDFPDELQYIEPPVPAAEAPQDIEGEKE